MMNRKLAIAATAMLAFAMFSANAMAFDDEAGCYSEVRDAEQLLIKANVSTENFATIGNELGQIRSLCGTDLNGAKSRLAAAVSAITEATGK